MADPVVRFADAAGVPLNDERIDRARPFDGAHFIVLCGFCFMERDCEMVCFPLGPKDLRRTADAVSMLLNRRSSASAA